MAIDDFGKNIVLQNLQADWLSGKNIRLDMLRLDLVDSVISGNKWYKLKENIRLAQIQNKTTLLTFGGQWSNHLVATAAAAQHFGLASIGLVSCSIRETEWTSTLKACQSYGMRLHRLSPDMYRKRYEQAFLEDCSKRYPEAFIIPEGGNNAAGIKGVKEIAKWFPPEVTHIALPVGTGTTLAGIRQAADKQITILGFCPFKKMEEQQATISCYCPEWSKNTWLLFADTKWKGFGRMDDALLEFMNRFYGQFGIPLDVVYTGKMMYYLQQLIQNSQLQEGSHVLAVHTGGLQGNASVARRLIYIA